MVVNVLSAADSPESSRTIEVTHRYLHLPVSERGEARRMQMRVDGEMVRQLDIVLTDAPDFWVFSDVSKWKGQRMTLIPAEGAGSGLRRIRQSDELPGQDRMYREVHRPGFHFTSRRGWLNDPNGLVYYDGEWHLFYQHNPYGWEWGNMHWGHAVSRDLFHWEELEKTFHPFGEDTVGAAYSGSAVVDHANTTGWKTGDTDVIVAAFTDTGSGEVVAYSNDRGRSFTLYEGNPVLRHQGRDPKVVWYEPTNRWVIPVYQEADDARWIAFYSSPDLKVWTFESRIGGFYECPDLFQLPVDGDASKSKWVLYGGDAKYVLGMFDGKTFTPEHDGKHQVWHGEFYAAQTYDNAPNDRRVQIGWARGVEFPGMPFNQQMAVPVELTLRSTGEGARLFAEPVKELAGIRGRTKRLKDLTLASGDTHSLEGFQAELVELNATFVPGNAGRIHFGIRGVEVTYDAGEQVVECAGLRVPLAPVEGEVGLQILLDRGSVECFGNSGQVAISRGVRPDSNSRNVNVRTEGAEVTFSELRVNELKPTWAP